MNFSLTINNLDATAVGRVLAAVSGTGAIVAATGANSPLGQAINGDDEDGGAPASTATHDATGLPWDERIHSKGKTLTESGAWRKKKGVADALVAAVEAELRNGGGNPAPVAQQPIAPVVQQQPASVMPQAPAPQMQIPQQPVMMPAMPTIAPTPAPQMPSMPPMPVMQAPAPVVQQQQPAPVGAMDFSTFMQHLSAGMNQHDQNNVPLITSEYLVTLAAEIGGAFGVQLGSITDIATDPNKINYAVQLIQRDGRWR